jgi:hypothetical protein
MRTAGRLVLTLLMVALLGAMLSPPAEAHRAAQADALPLPAPSPALEEAPSRLAWSAAPAAPLPAWTVLAALVVAGLAGARRPRRALALALVVFVAVLTLESGVHSVHHLADVDRGESCAVASASQHLSGVEVDALLTAAPLAATGRLAITGTLLGHARIIGPAQGRAPPALPV